MKTTFKPTCPNHGCPLDSLPFPLPRKGTGICPVSGCSFDFEVELDESKLVRDVNGNVTKELSYAVTGNE